MTIFANDSIVGSVLGGGWSNAVLYKICSVLCVLEQPTVDNSNEGSHKRVAQLGVNGSIRLRPVLFKSISELNACIMEIRCKKFDI